MKPIQVAVIVCLGYAYATKQPTTTVIVEPSAETLFDWVEPWYSAPIVKVTEEAIYYQDQIIATTQYSESDGSVFSIQPLERRLREAFSDVGPRSPHARRRRAHAVACESVQRADRRILCNGRFVVVERDFASPPLSLARIVNTIEKVDLYAVVTWSSRN